MEIKSNKSANYPLLIDDLVKELLKDVLMKFIILIKKMIQSLNLKKPM